MGDIPPVAGAPVPAESNKRWYKVKRAKCGLKRIVTLLAPTILGEWGHWVGCTVRCEHTPDCWRCKKRQPVRYEAYIAAFEHNCNERIVLGLSEGGARQMLIPLTKYGTLRGLRIEIWRSADEKENSRVLVKEIARFRDEDTMEEHSIMDSLHRMWGMNEQTMTEDVTPIVKPAKCPLILGAPVPVEAKEPAPHKDTEPAPARAEQIRELLRRRGVLRDSRGDSGVAPLF